MFFSDAVIIILPLSSSSSSSSRSVSIGGCAVDGVDAVVKGSCSGGIVRTERGRLPRAFFLGLGGANFTGEGESEGSFSLEGMFSSSFSSFSSFSLSEFCGCGCGCGVNRGAPRPLGPGS